MLCVVINVFASPYASATMKYTSTYNSSGRKYVYTTSSAHRTHISSGFSMAQTPIATMRSTSSHQYAAANNRGINYVSSSSSISGVRGIHTMASTITGGVTTFDEGPHRGHIRKVIIPDVCEHCDFELNEEGEYECIYCHATLLDGCECTPDCHCPLPLDWTAILFLLALTCAYVTYKEMKKSRA